MRRLRIAVGLTALVMLSAGAMAWAAQKTEGKGQKPDVTERERAPDGVRVRVQVLNGTKTRGLARRCEFGQGAGDQSLSAPTASYCPRFPRRHRISLSTIA